MAPPGKDDRSGPAKNPDGSAQPEGTAQPVFAERYGPRPDWHPETLAVHAGQEPDEATGGVAPPIHPAATFAQEAVGRPRGGWEYARSGNPTRARLERAIAALDGAEFGLAFASGSAATATLAALAGPGEEIVVSDDVYGGTYRYFEQVARQSGIVARYADLSRFPAETLRSLLSERTRLVWLETPSNPLLKIVDVAAVATIARSHVGARGEAPILVVDNRFATPPLQRRLERHGTNAQQVAEALASRSDVARVLYPGLASGKHAHPQAALVARQMRGMGGMVSFEPAAANGRSAEERARRFCEGTHIFVLGESLGGVESLVELPAAMTHASVAGSTLEPPAALVRLSVGVEHVDDLVADVAQALDAA